MAQKSATNFVPENFNRSSELSVKKKDRHAARLFYRLQTVHEWQPQRKQQKVSILITQNVHESWKGHIRNAIRSINLAAPGLHLYTVESLSCSPQIIIFGESGEEAYTLACIQKGEAYIFLGDDWPNEGKQGTSLHELLHALGFGHEHQRGDVQDCIDTTEALKDSEWADQYSPSENGIGITRFDPLSVMFYPENRYNKRQKDSDIIWELKPFPEQNHQMSELDKVGLNIVFPPCKTGTYNPKISSTTGFYYCGRSVMNSHNYPADNTTDGNCGRDNWGNCPACRTLKTPALNAVLRQGKWQGMSGLVYCGRYFGKQEEGHDGYCGPDNGLPCNNCAEILYPDSSCVLL